MFTMWTDIDEPHRITAGLTIMGKVSVRREPDLITPVELGKPVNPANPDPVPDYRIRPPL